MSTDNYTAINQIPITEVLDKLGLKWEESCPGSDYVDIYIGDELTSGFKAFKSSNRVHDFSHSRGQGKPFYFVKSFLGLSDRDTFLRFEEGFTSLQFNNNGTGNNSIQTVSF